MTGPTREFADGIFYKLMGVVTILVGLGCLHRIDGVVDWSVWAFIRSIAGSLLLLLGGRAYLYGRKLDQETIDELLNRDTRPPVLLLRSFRMDEREILSRFTWTEFFTQKRATTFEEELAKTFKVVGPVIAVGNPVDAVRPLGAARTYASNEEWQTKVLDLAAKSSHLVIILDTTPGVRWELEQVMPRFENRNVTLLFPPSLTDVDFERVRELLSHVAIDKEVDRGLMAISFDSNGNRMKLVSKSKSLTKRLDLLGQYLDPARRAQLQDSSCAKCSVSFRDSVSDSIVNVDECVKCSHEFTVSDEWHLGPDKWWLRALRGLKYASTGAVLVIVGNAFIVNSENLGYSNSYSFEPNYEGIPAEEYACSVDHNGTLSCGTDNTPAALLKSYQTVRENSSGERRLESWERDPSTLPVPATDSEEYEEYQAEMLRFKLVADRDPLKYALLKGLIEGKIRYKQHLQWKLDRVALGVAVAICSAALWHVLFLGIYKIIVTLSYEPPESIRRHNLAEITSREG
ncbi:MAG: hypothetical protein OJF50_005956 [Nitrospira sp.]|nr:hypothetical protein [Nitrospira sp.]